MTNKASDDAWAKGMQLALLVLACIWGADYLMKPPSESRYTAEMWLPLAPLGVAILTFGIVGIIGWGWKDSGRRNTSPDAPFLCRIQQRWWPSFIAHTVLCAIYAGLGVVGGAEQVWNNHLHGGRVTAAMLVLSAAHWWHAQNSRDVS